jgi:alpha-1,6-mannosyltransferase
MGPRERRGSSEVLLDGRGRTLSAIAGDDAVRSLRRARAALAACAIVEGAFLVVIARMPDLGVGFSPFARLFLLGSIPWLAAVWVGTRFPVAKDRFALALVVGAAVVFRAFFLLAEPTLSDDVHRFVWEGRVGAAGFDPYVHAPDSPELAPLRDATWARINHREIPSCYPPALELQLAAAAALAPSALFVKGLFLAWDLAVVGLSIVLLRRRGRPDAQAAIYAWSPLVVVEIAGNAHPEPVWVALLLAAVLLEGRRIASGAALALAAATKLVPIAFLPAFARRLRGAGLAAFAVAAALVVLPYASAGAALFDGMREYADRWRANDSLFRFVLAAADALREQLLRVHWIAERLWAHPRLGSSLSIAKGIAALALVALAVWMWRRRIEPVRFALVLYAAILALSPVVHPWYVVPLVALLTFEPNLPGLLLGVLVVLAYHPLPAWRQTGVWSEDSFYATVEWVPVYAALAVSAASRLWSRRRRPIAAA